MARRQRLAPSKGRAWIVVILALLVGVIVALHRSGQGAQATPVPYLGLNGMSMPTAPQPFMAGDYAVTKHFRQTSGSVGNGYGPPADSGNETMMADHGADCGAPPATHQVGTGYADIVFVCHGHVMTAINSASYGEVLFQPAQLVDFTNGPATVSISVSTFRSSSRDWIDWLFVPFAEQLAVNTDNDAPESVKLPMDYLRVGQVPGGGFTVGLAEEGVHGVPTRLATDWWTDLNSLVPASKTVRTPITMTISRTHLTLVAAGHTFVDDDLPTPLPFTQAVFQTMHHSYNPTKEGAGTPNTWHWSDVTISNAVPYTMSMAMPEAVGDYSWLGQRVTFPPAPAGAHLRAQWFDTTYSSTPSGSISFDNGATWQPLAAQHLAPITGIVSGVAMVNLWQPVPQGATSALLRGAGGWYARDLYLMAPGGGTGTTSAPTATPMPPMSTSTTGPLPGPLPINGVPCTVTVSGVTQTGTCSGTFVPSH